MRCLACGAEMLVEHVAPDDTMPVSGYEHRTLRCPQCGDTERRLVFAGDRTSAENIPVETTSSVIEMTSPVIEATSSIVETTSPIIEATSSIVETTSPVIEATSSIVETISSPAPATRGQEQLDVAPDPGPVTKRDAGSSAKPDAGPAARWALAVEKVRTRQMALTQAVTAEKKPTNTAAVRSNETKDDFDRMWESPVPPRRQPSPPREPSSPGYRDEPLHGASPTPAPKPRTSLSRTAALSAVKWSDAAPAPVQPKPPTERQTPQSETSESNTSQNKSSRGAWARAVTMLREQLDRATKRDRAETILRIDDNALKVEPRRDESRPSKPESPG